MIEGGPRHGTGARLASSLAALMSLSLTAVAQDAGVRVVTTTITSSGAHKECLSLSRTQSLHYWFRSDAPIDFDIQYQDSSGVVYPVRRKHLSVGTGSYPAKTAEVYCVVLTNPAHKPVTVRLEFGRLER